MVKVNAASGTSNVLFKFDFSPFLSFLVDVAVVVQFRRFQQGCGSAKSGFALYPVLRTALSTLATPVFFVVQFTFKCAQVSDCDVVVRSLEDLGVRKKPGTASVFTVLT